MVIKFNLQYLNLHFILFPLHSITFSENASTRLKYMKTIIIDAIKYPISFTDFLAARKVQH